MRQAVGVEDEINYYLCPKFEKNLFVSWEEMEWFDY